jgi:hypothetical protein
MDSSSVLYGRGTFRLAFNILRVGVGGIVRFGPRAKDVHTVTKEDVQDVTEQYSSAIGYKVYADYDMHLMLQTMERLAYAVPYWKSKGNKEHHENDATIVKLAQTNNAPHEMFDSNATIKLIVEMIDRLAVHSIKAGESKYVELNLVDFIEI